MLQDIEKLSGTIANCDVTSLSMAETMQDNAVSEATYKVFKTEFVMNNTFNGLDELKFKLADYVHWFNNMRP